MYREHKAETNARVPSSTFLSMGPSCQTFSRHSRDIPQTFPGHSPDIPKHPRTSLDDVRGCPGMSGHVRGCPGNVRGMSGISVAPRRKARCGGSSVAQVLVRPSRFWPPWSRRRRELRGTAGRESMSPREGELGRMVCVECSMTKDPAQLVIHGASSGTVAAPGPGARRLWQPWAPRSLWLFSKGLGKLELQSGGPLRSPGCAQALLREKPRETAQRGECWHLPACVLVGETVSRDTEVVRVRRSTPCFCAWPASRHSAF